jgi:hypothetical protein
MFERLKEQETKADLEFDKLIEELTTTNESPTDNTSNSGYFLVTLEFQLAQYESLVENFPNGSVQLNLHLNSRLSSDSMSNGQLFKQDVPVWFDIYKDLVQMGKEAKRKVFECRKVVQV